MATVDPWEVRTCRTVRVQSSAHAGLVLTALLTRERPSFLVVPRVHRNAVERGAVAAAQARGVVVLAAPSSTALRAVADKLSVLVPEVAMEELTRPVRAALTLATATLHALPLRGVRPGSASRQPAHARQRRAPSA